MSAVKKNAPIPISRAAAHRHPWQVQLKALGTMSVPLAVFDITEALGVLRERSDVEHAPKIFEAAALSSQICQGICVVDATRNVQDLFQAKSLGEFSQMIIQVLQGATIPQWQHLTTALVRPKINQVPLALTSVKPAASIHVRVLELKTRNGRIFALAGIQDSARTIEQSNRLDRFESLLEHSADFIAIIGPNGKLEYMNRSAADILGKFKSEFPASGLIEVQEIFSAASVVTVVGACQSLVSGASHWAGVLELTISGGANVSLDCNICPVRKKSGGLAISGFSVIGRKTINPMVAEYESEMKDRVIDATSQLALLGHVSNQMCHEINNPLTVVTGKAEKLLALARANDINPSHYVACAEKIIAMMARTEKAIKSMRSIVRQNNGSGRMKVQVREILHNLKDLIESASQRVLAQTILPEMSADLCVYVNPAKLSYILLNVFGRSYEAVSAQSDGVVSLNIEADAHWIHLKVNNNGRAVTKDLQIIPAESSEEFLRSRHDGGRANLSLSCQLAKTCGGDLYIDEHSRNGTTIVLKLPRQVNESSETGGDWEEI